MRKCEVTVMECLMKLEMAEQSVEVAGTLAASDHLEASKLLLEKAQLQLGELKTKMQALSKFVSECVSAAEQPKKK